MEREFLLGIDFGLYVDKTTYESWLNLLKGLVMAKERDSKHWQRSRCPVRTSHLHRPHCHRHAHAPQSRAVSHRARSSSPRRSSICAASHSPAYAAPRPQQYTPASTHLSPYATPARSDYPAGSKRSAEAAFSPTSASFPAAQQPPAQVPRRAHGLTLDIPQPLAHSRESSASPLESLQSFSKLSLGHSPADHGSVHVWPAVRHDDYPRTLVSAYRMDDQRQAVAPQVSSHLTSQHRLRTDITPASVLLLASRLAYGVGRGASLAQGQTSLLPGTYAHRPRIPLSAFHAHGRAVGVDKSVRDAHVDSRSPARSTAVLGGITGLDGRKRRLGR